MARQRFAAIPDAERSQFERLEAMWGSVRYQYIHAVTRESFDLIANAMLNKHGLKVRTLLVDNHVSVNITTLDEV